jgi:PAS domain-containing protein
MATTTREPGQPPEAAPALSDQVTPLLTHLTDVAVEVVDRELRYVGAGGAGLQAAGWEATELLGRTVYELVPPEEAAIRADRYRRALAERDERLQALAGSSGDMLALYERP